MRTVVTLDGQPCTLELSPSSVRSKNFQALRPLPDGTYVPIAAPPARTLRGTALEIPGSVVAGSMMDDGLHARVILPNNVQHWIEPLQGRVAGATQDTYAVYRNDDVIPSGSTCSVAPGGAAAAIQPAIAAPVASSNGSVAGTVIFIAELLIDTDVEYFLSNGSTAATMAEIESVINTMNIQFERDVFIRHVISTIIVRDGPISSDPYTATFANDLLAEFRNTWRSNPTPRDVAELFTGKNMDGSTVGIAHVGVICNSSFGFNVVQSKCCGGMACRTDLSAHELGHNWNAGHCTCSTFTMNRGLTCRNVFNPVGTIPSITAHRDSRTCLDQGDTLRRIILSAPSETVLEGSTLPFTVMANFKFAANQDVSSQTTWLVDPPSAGTFDANSVFTGAEVAGDACATLTASFTADGITKTKSAAVMIRDTNTIRSVIAAIPPSNTIDARQPTEPTGFTAQGWNTIDLLYNGETCLTTPSTYSVSVQGGLNPAPTITTVDQLGFNTVRLTLSAAIEPGAWTTITDLDTGETFRLGSLPGDVNGDGVVNGADVQALADALQGINGNLPIWSRDLDRSDVLAPGDYLRLIDLLNGAELYETWNGRSLPP